MLKKYLALLCALCLLWAVGCNAQEPTPSGLEGSNASLIVAGVDITQGNYVYIDAEKQRAELPLLAVLTQLGATVEWQDENEVKISTEQSFITFNKTHLAFDLLYTPQAVDPVRKVIGNEFVADTATGAAALIRELTGATVSINYETNTVTVR